MFKTQNNTGFTLIEIIISLGIFTLIVGVIGVILITSLKSRDIIYEQLLTQNEGRKIVQDFVNEFRSASVSSIGAYPLVKASSTEVIFYTNLDTDTLRERVRYFVQGIILKKGIIKPSGNPLAYATSTETIIEVVHSLVVTTTPIFTYYDQSYSDSVTSTPLAQPVNTSLVRVVGINLMLEKNPNVSPAPFTIQAKASMRNLKSN